MLSAGYTPKECTEIFKWAIPHIFGHFPFRRINPFVAKYDDKPKEQILREFFGDRTMVDLKKACAVVAFRFDGRRSRTHSFFDKEGWRPAIYSNMAKAEGLVLPDYDLKVRFLPPLL
jgi:patatin-like phospholipase/acyl hydrolase